MKYSISTALAGYDEVSLTSPTKVFNNSGEFVLESKDFGLNILQPDEMERRKNQSKNSKIFLSVLEGNSTKAQKRSCFSKPALALKTIYPTKDLIECVAIAERKFRQ